MFKKKYLIQFTNRNFKHREPLTCAKLCKKLFY